MTSPGQAGEAPAPVAAPGPVSAPRKPAQAADPAGRVAALEAELARARAEAAAGPKVSLKLGAGESISSFSLSGAVVTHDPSPVPAHLVQVLLEQAAEAGVTIEEA
jgi:hypothetical protein